jgi:hypothetical protein
MTGKYGTSKPAIAAIAFVLGLTLAGGVAAVAAAKPTAVKACVDSHHFLATASKHKCPRGTHALTIGVKGPRGARGSKGAKGAKGANGLSQVLVGKDLTSTLSGYLDVTYVDVLSIPSAPAGNYLVTFSLETHNTAASGNPFLECWVGSGEPVSNELKDETVPSGDFATLSASAAVTLATAGPIEVQCHG